MAVDIRENSRISPSAVRYARIIGLFVIVLLIAGIALAHLYLTPWASLLLYNGDSLTLALIAKSIRTGESFHWILSSQLFLFPEGLFYAASSILVPATKYSFLLNAFLNLLSLFALYFLIAKSILKDVGRSEAFAISGLCLAVFYMLCEAQPEVNRRTIASIFLIATYYYGAILASLLLLYLHIELIKRCNANASGRVKGLFGSSIVVITGLTYFSDPLLLLQFSLPFLTTVFLVGALQRLSYRHLGVAIVLQLLGLIAGQIFRHLCRDIIGNVVASYIDFGKINASIMDCWSVVVEIVEHGLSLLEYSVMFGVLLVSVGLAIFLCARGRRAFFHGDSTLSTVSLIVVFFAVICPISTIFAIIASGNSYTRYFVPLVFIPALGLIPLFYMWKDFSREKTLMFFFVFVLIAFVSYVSPRLTSAQSAGYSDSESVDCYNHYMSQKSFNAVGGFWTVRALDLYSTSGSRVLQIVDFGRMRWMNNSSPYFNLSFNGVIVNKSMGGAPAPNFIYAETVTPLGPYTKKLSCKEFDIYYYDENSPGFRLLNSILKK
jgi:hypothetical protein